MGIVSLTLPLAPVGSLLGALIAAGVLIYQGGRRQLVAGKQGVRALMIRSTEYRLDIQLLRGVAIVSVLIYHLQPSWLRGGFLGVDLFFVISGFLMAALNDMTKMTAGAFYLKRARRILPAYYITIAVTAVCAAGLVLPHEMRDVTDAALYATALLGNVGPWMHASYFDKAYFQPLLHLWSLGVEAQFYLLFPLAAAIWRRQPWALVLIAGTSLVGCLLFVVVSSKSAFFLTPFRLWEFGAGFFAAKLVATRPAFGRSSLATFVGLAGLSAILILTLMPVPEDTHPGIAAIALVVATSAILIAGLPEWLVESSLGRLGALLGKYSYSIYLVHYPIIALLLYRPFAGAAHADLTLDAGLLAVGATGGAAFALYHVVEHPLRRTPASRYWVPQGVIVVAVALGVLVLPQVQSARFTPAQNRIFAAWTDRGEFRCGKMFRLLEPRATSCELTKGGGPVALLVGNSHADAVKIAFAEVAHDAGYRLRLTAKNCALGSPECPVETIAAEAKRVGARTVLLHSGPGSVEPVAIAQLVRAGSSGGFSVVLIDPIPVWSESVPELLYRTSVGGEPAVQTRADYERANGAFFTAVSAIHDPRFRRVETAQIFCRPRCSLSDESGAPLYLDGEHLTLTGSRKLYPAMRAALGRSTQVAQPSERPL